MTRRSFAQISGAALALGLTRRLKAADIYSSSEGQLSVGLEARLGYQSIGGRTVQVLTYNGQMPGPVLKLRAGDTLRIRFRNSLDEPTNLHFHGLHVSPNGNSDNAFAMVAPGETLDYEIAIPANHPSGTFWYHPHLHGLTAKQVFGGLSGLIIIRGGLDAIDEIAAAPEAMLILKDFSFDASGRVVDAALMNRMQGREGAVVTVNGEVAPNFTIQQGGLLRCRALNASSSRYYRLCIQGHPMGMIGSDGGSLARVDWRDEMLIVPGQRVEFLLEGNRNPATYRIQSLPYNRGAMGMMGLGQAANDPLLLGQLTYSGVADQFVSAPDRLLDVEALPYPNRPLRTFRLSEGMMRSFDINGRTFDPRRIDTAVELDTIEEWELVNTGQMDHPFHVHTNPFQLVGSDGLVERAWRDVVNVPRGGRQRIRSHFADFTGKTVYHCHILDHEDLGMMGTLEIRS